MRRKRFGLLVVGLVALNLFLWLAPPGLALRQSLVARLFGPRLVRADVITYANGAAVDTRVDRGIVTAQTPTQLTLQEVDGRVQAITLSPTTRFLGRKNLQGWRVLVIWQANGAATAVQAELRPRGQGTGAGQHSR